MNNKRVLGLKSSSSFTTDYLILKRHVSKLSSSTVPMLMLSNLISKNIFTLKVDLSWPSQWVSVSCYAQADLPILKVKNVNSDHGWNVHSNVYFHL